MIDRETAARLKRTIASVYETSFWLTLSDVAWFTELIDRETSDARPEVELPRGNR